MRSKTVTSKIFVVYDPDDTTSHRHFTTNFDTDAKFNARRPLGTIKYEGTTMGKAIITVLSKIFTVDAKVTAEVCCLYWVLE